MAQALITGLTEPGDLVVDPFCGSGVVPLEAAATGRRVLAGDWNPYAFVLTRAKLFPPRNLEAALSRFEQTWMSSRKLLGRQDLRIVPRWVRLFFHPQTLRNALAFRDACVVRNETFLLACLLGILHHQRPGFLSYPSSHLVPYLRDKKFPPDTFSHLYQERDVRSRMIAKIQRSYKRLPHQMSPQRGVMIVNACKFPQVSEIQAVITSPPYMNELDYIRDNRLRLWFIKRALSTRIKKLEQTRAIQFLQLLRSACCHFAPMIRPGGFFALVLGDATRGRKPVKTASLAKAVFMDRPELQSFDLVRTYNDKIPDIRRSRRECRGTKTETILIYRRRSS